MFGGLPVSPHIDSPGCPVELDVDLAPLRDRAAFSHHPHGLQEFPGAASRIRSGCRARNSKTREPATTDPNDTEYDLWQRCTVRRTERSCNTDRNSDATSHARCHLVTVPITWAGR